MEEKCSIGALSHSYTLYIIAHSRCYFVHAAASVVPNSLRFNRNMCLLLMAAQTL
jgi:hypothetical protein